MKCKGSGGRKKKYEILNLNSNACAQKKLNYAVIIDECKARIKWCIENVQADINEIFMNNIYQLQIYEDNIFTKIKRIIFNKILGKSKFKRFLENYENEYIDEVLKGICDGGLDIKRGSYMLVTVSSLGVRTNVFDKLKVGYF